MHRPLDRFDSREEYTPKPYCEICGDDQAALRWVDNGSISELWCVNCIQRRNERNEDDANA